MNDIYFTAAIDESIAKQIDVFTKFNNFNFIGINKYFGSFSELGIIFQCFPNNDPVRQIKEYKKLRRKTQTLELYLILDYNIIMTNNESENYIYIYKVFEKGCETFLKPLKNFDYTGFITEIAGKISTIKK